MKVVVVVVAAVVVAIFVVSVVIVVVVAVVVVTVIVILHTKYTLYETLVHIIAQHETCMPLHDDAGGISALRPAHRSRGVGG